MRGKAGFGVLLILCFLVIAEGLSWVTASGPSPCLITIENDDEAAYNNNQKSCPTFRVGSEILLIRLDGFIGSHEKSIIAAFTVVLACSTIGLWLSTNALWKAGERQLVHFAGTAERELRAYVYVEKTNIKFQGGWNIEYRLKNFGKTPAHNVRLISIAKVVDWNGGNPEIPVPNHVETVGSMAPQGDFFDFTEELEGRADFDEIKNGSKAIFLVGSIIYDIVFEPSRRTTDFRYYVGGDMNCDDFGKMNTTGGEMFAASEGNDAT